MSAIDDQTAGADTKDDNVESRASASGSETGVNDRAAFGGGVDELIKIYEQEEDVSALQLFEEE
jgi:hypothetical protein